MLLSIDIPLLSTFGFMIREKTDPLNAPQFSAGHIGSLNPSIRKYALYLLCESIAARWLAHLLSLSL